MPTTRKRLLGAAVVFAIAMVVGAWTTSTRGGEREDPMVITALLDGYANPPTKLEGTLCIAHVSTNGHEVAPVVWNWNSTAHPNFNASQRQIQANLGYTSGWMTVTAVDAVDQEDTDDVWVSVSLSGDTCEG